MLHVNEPLPDIRELVPGLPPDLFAVLTRVLAKKREERFATALELDDALARCDTGPAAPLAEDRLLPEAEAFLREVEVAIDSIILPRGSRSAPRTEAPKTLVATRPRRRPPVVLVVEEEVRELLKLATALCMTGCRTLEVTKRRGGARDRPLAPGRPRPDGHAPPGNGRLRRGADPQVDPARGAPPGPPPRPAPPTGPSTPSPSSPARPTSSRSPSPRRCSRRGSGSSSGAGASCALPRAVPAPREKTAAAASRHAAPGAVEEPPLRGPAAIIRPPEDTMSDVPRTSKQARP